jgi:osmoprotectant transport system permease protein
MTRQHRRLHLPAWLRGLAAVSTAMLLGPMACAATAAPTAITPAAPTAAAASPRDGARAAGGSARLTIGSKRFTESYILGEVATRVAQAAGEAQVRHEQGLGNTGIVFAALGSGAIDAYVEYTGTLAREILRLPDPDDRQALAQALAARGLAMSAPLGFNNTYALAMAEVAAARLGVSRISDLAAHPTLRLGLTQEFIGRADGWAGLRARYALPFGTPRGVEHGIKFGALAQGQLDVIDVYSTDAAIERHRLRVLADDRSYFPRYDAVLLYRIDSAQRLPRTFAALRALAGRFDDATMRGLNAGAEVQSLSFAQVAESFLAGPPIAPAPPPGVPATSAGDAVSAGLAPPGDRAGMPATAPASPAGPAERRALLPTLFDGDFLRLSAEHALLVFVSLALSVLVGVPLGVWCAHSAAARRIVLPAVGLIQTVPALALLAFLITLYARIGLWPALTALFLYGLLPIVRNTCSGLEVIPQSLRDSAAALGLSRRARLLRIELPLALAPILAGIQTSAVINVGTATIAAFIGAGGYGERIATGLALNDNTVLLAGALPAAGFALLVQFAFALIERRAIPAGLRTAPR